MEWSLVGGGSALRRALRCSAKSHQSVALKLGQGAGVLAGSLVSSSLIMGRWSVCGGWAAGSVLQLINALHSSVEQNTLSGLV